MTRLMKLHLLQSNLVAAKVRIYSIHQLQSKRQLEVLVEFLLRSRQVSLAEVDDHDGQVTLETNIHVDKRRLHVVLLLQTGEDHNHTAQKGNGRLEATHHAPWIRIPSDSQKQVQGVVECVHGEILTIEVLRVTVI